MSVIMPGASVQRLRAAIITYGKDAGWLAFFVSAAAVSWKVIAPDGPFTRFGLGGLALWFLWHLPAWQLRGIRTKKFAAAEPKDLKDLEIKARSGLAQAVGGLALLAGLFFTWKTANLTREGQITERFTRAVDLLARAHGDGRPNLESRIGGIYALERVAKDSEADSWSVVEILSAYVRENSPAVAPPPETAEGYRARSDIQAAVLAIGRRKWREHESSLQLIVDLSHSDLRGVDLTRAYLVGANLAGSRFARAVLVGANLNDADLSQADFSNASLMYTSMRMRDEALLVNTRFDGADLSDADLRGSSFTGTSFKHATLHRTHFEEVRVFFGIDFSDAIFMCTHLEGARLDGDVKGLDKAQLAVSFLDEKTLVPQSADPRHESYFKRYQEWAHVKAGCKGWRELRREPAPVTPPTR